MNPGIDRRTFLSRIATGGGGLVLGLWLSACTDDTPGPAHTTSGATTGTPAATATTTTTAAASGIESDPSARFEPHLLLRIDGDDIVTITVPKVEMGQGVRTSLAMMVAEELDADWSNVRVETAPGNRAFGDQVTGGSLSVSTRFDPMRRVGGTARHMLIAAAADLWGVQPEQCTTEPGEVVERDGERRATFGALAGAASEIEPPATADVTLKDPANFRIIGTPVGSIDAADFVSGKAIYGSDVMLPDMLFAVLARSPVFGGRVAFVDDAEARRIPGVVDVLEISNGVAVVAENTWAAMQGRDALLVEWDPGDNASQSDASIRRELTERLERASLGPDDITADYAFPYFAHAAMEPLVGVADLSGGSSAMWAATQRPQLARAVAAAEISVPTDDVTMHIPLVGGGFGRRLDQDFVREAAELGVAIGRPVKLVWSRTDDLRHDRYHPAGVCRAVGNSADPTGVDLQMELWWDGPVPTGDWRSVTNAPEAFAHESFIDELAFAAARDPYDYRRDMLQGAALASLDLAAEAAGWREPLAEGWGRGIAHHATWDVSPTTAVAEVEVIGDTIHVRRVVMAIECGIVVNPDTVAAQMDGAVAFGLSAALLGGVSIVGGGVAESNYHDAPILRFDAMPTVETHIVPSSGRPTGVGEAGVPPVAPAVANAVFAATGRRLRELPLRLG